MKTTELRWYLGVGVATVVLFTLLPWLFPQIDQIMLLVLLIVFAVVGAVAPFFLFRFYTYGGKGLALWDRVEFWRTFGFLPSTKPTNATQELVERVLDERARVFLKMCAEEVRLKRALGDTTTLSREALLRTHTKLLRKAMKVSRLKRRFWWAYELADYFGFQVKERARNHIRGPIPELSNTLGEIDDTHKII